MNALRERLENLRWVRFAFLRGLGVTFGLAFASLAVQVRGLIGVQGILPAAEWLARTRQSLGGVSLPLVPTLFWWGASDPWLVGACLAGVALSALLVAGVAQRWVLLLLWALYLSLMTVGGPFLHFQWDSFLLETALTALPLAPGGLWTGVSAETHGRVPAPSRAAVLLLKLLLFKLMFLSGLVKIASGDGTWRHLTALQFHFWTQPLPALPGWWAAQLPGPLLQLLCAGTLFAELLLPFGAFGPRSLRRATGLGLMGLQLLIALTGNYGFFNLLTALLCLLLLDDDWFRRWIPRLPRGTDRPGSGLKSTEPMSPWALPAFGLVALLSLAVSAERFTPLPESIEAGLELLGPFASMNGYGLFAVMTTHRDEIHVEGSNDGVHWREYRFRDKPGPLDRVPSYVQPHMPRLDWQMWFAALGGSCRQNRWYLAFAQALLEHRAPVVALLADDPFPVAPPRFLRSTVSAYAPVTPADLRAQGVYWREGPARPYCPTLVLRNGALAAVSAEP